MPDVDERLHAARQWFAANPDKHDRAVTAVGNIDRASDLAAVAVDAMSGLPGFEAADVALQLQAARVALLAAQNKAKRLLARGAAR